MQTLKSTGRSAIILAATRQAVGLARECPCGREILAQMLAAPTLKGLEIDLCRSGRRSEWLRYLLSSGVVRPVVGSNKNRIRVVLESPILMSMAHYEREKKKKKKT